MIPVMRNNGQLFSRRMRTWTGLVLFLFAITHFLNHSLGLVSIEAMQVGQDIRVVLTQSALGTAVLLFCAITHSVLGIAKFLRARTLRLGMRSWVQLGFGLLIPILLIRHVIGTRGVRTAFDTQTNYDFVLWATWPNEAVNLAILITLVWVHGCIGIHHWLSHRAFYRRFLWLWYGFAVLIPSFAYAGFVSAGRLHAAVDDFENPFSSEQYIAIQGMFLTGKLTYGVILGLSIAVWVALLIADRFRASISVSYTDGPTIVATKGLSLLDVSRKNRIPHASVCGGRARCSTCRVRVTKGLQDQPPADEAELKVLRRVGAPANVRLACQLRPTASLTIAALLPGNLASAGASVADKYQWGVERDVTLLFCDLRGFTQMSEGRLSFDVVFLLNQFLGRMATAIEDSGGFVDKFMGDGIMAIFGMETSPEVGARQAIAAARAMGGDLDSLNQSLREDLPNPLAMGIGIHSGPVILGRIGSGNRNAQGATLTALGEVVNLASRLESKTKDLGVQVAVSVVTIESSGLTPAAPVKRVSADVRGMSVPVEIYVAKRATDLPTA